MAILLLWYFTLPSQNNITFNNLEPEEQISAAAEVTKQLIQATEPRNNSLLPQDLGASARILTAVVDVLENNSASDNVNHKIWYSEPRTKWRGSIAFAPYLHCTVYINLIFVGCYWNI